MKDPVQDYLQRYAASEVGHLKPIAACEHVLVIPAFAETLEDICGVWQHLDAHLLVIIVVNSSQADTTTEQLLGGLLAYGTTVWQSGNLTLLQARHPLLAANDDGGPSLQLLVVDRYSNGVRFEEGQGVGLARKIGSDLALAVIQRGDVGSPWIHATDADTILPKTCLTPAHQAPCSARLFPFVHEPAATLSVTMRQALDLYDLSLLHYAAMLQEVGSPYGFPTLGSAMAINAGDYARVRGYPLRLAGEDFYLLDKLAKVAPVRCEAGAPVRVTGRPSTRVPFGTGPGIRRIAELSDPASEYLFYNPACFAGVAELRTAMLDSRAKQSLTVSAALTAYVAAQQLDSRLAKVWPQYRSDATWQRFVDSWLDSGRTLRLIHHLRDTAFPGINLAGLLDRQGASDLMSLRMQYENRLFADSTA